MAGSSRVMMSPCRGTIISCPERPGKYPRANISRNRAREGGAAVLAARPGAGGGAGDVDWPLIVALRRNATPTHFSWGTRVTSACYTVITSAGCDSAVRWLTVLD